MIRAALFGLCLVPLLSGCESSTEPAPTEPSPNEGVLLVDVHPLEIPEGASGVGMDLHESGQAVGFLDEGGVLVGVRWIGTELVDRWELEGRDVLPAAVNGSGLVAGWIRFHEDPCSYTAFFDGEEITPSGETACAERGAASMVDAGVTPPGWAPLDMNEAGDVVVWGGAHIYRQDGAIHLESLEGVDCHSLTWCQTAGISDDGRIVGWNGSGTYHGMVWWTVDGETGGFPSNVTGRHARAVGISPSGLAILATGHYSSDMATYDFRNEVGRVLRDEEGWPLEGRLTGVNDAGGLIGFRDAGPFYLPPDGEIEDFQEPRDVEGQWEIEDVVVLDERGWILGHARETGNANALRPVLLAPVESTP